LVFLPSGYKAAAASLTSPIPWFFSSSSCTANLVVVVTRCYGKDKGSGCTESKGSTSVSLVGLPPPIVITSNTTANDLVSAVLTSTTVENGTAADAQVQQFAAQLLSSVAQLTSAGGGVSADDSATVAAVKGAIDSVISNYAAIAASTAITSPDNVVARFSAISSLTSDTKYLSESSATASVSIIASSVDSALAAGVPISTDVGTSAIGALSNVLTISTPSASTNATSSTALAKDAAAAVQRLSNAMLASVQIGVAPAVISTATVSVALGRNYAGALTTPTVSNLGTESVTFPAGGGATGASNTDVIAMKAVSMKANANGGTVNSNVMTVSITGSAALVPNAAGIIPLSSNVKFKISGTFTAGQNYGCTYWDTASSSWSTFGCTTVSVATTYIDCSCNHTTDFAGSAVAAGPTPAPPGATQTGSTINTPALIGGLIGGILGGALLVSLVVIIIAAVVITRRRRKKSAPQTVVTDQELKDGVVSTYR
jgi:hypothetical protein